MPAVAADTRMRLATPAVIEHAFTTLIAWATLHDAYLHRSHNGEQPEPRVCSRSMVDTIVCSATMIDANVCSVTMVNTIVIPATVIDAIVCNATMVDIYNRL